MAITKRVGVHGSTYRVAIHRKGMSQLTRSFKKKSDATKWEAQQIADMNSHGIRDLSRAGAVTFADVSKQFTQDNYQDRMSTKPTPKMIERIERQKADFTNRRNTLQREFKSFNAPMNRIQGVDLTEYKKHRQGQDSPKKKNGEKISNNTIQRELDMISLVFQYAVTDIKGCQGLSNPIEETKRPARVPSRQRRLTPDEKLMLVEEAAKEEGMFWFRPMVEFQMWVGLRISESCNIEAGDVDLEKRTITLDHNKTDFPREIPLSTKGVEILKSFEWGGGNVFYTKAGNASNKFTKFKKKLLEDGKLDEDLTLHDLRHEATSCYFDMVHPDGAPMLGLQHVRQVTGHLSADTMLKTYVNKPDPSVVTGIKGF